MPGSLERRPALEAAAVEAVGCFVPAAFVAETVAMLVWSVDRSATVILLETASFVECQHDRDEETPQWPLHCSGHLRAHRVDFLVPLWTIVVVVEWLKPPLVG